MDLGQFAFAATVIIGLVNGIQFAFNRNWQAFVFFLVAVIAGTAFGALHWFGLPSIELGFALGVSSSGVYKLGQVVGAKK